MEIIANREQAQQEMENLINDISTQFRSTQKYQKNQMAYLRIYNWAYALKDQDIIVLKEIFREWIQKYLLQVVENILIQSKDFSETFIFEFNLLKILLKQISQLFRVYELTLGTLENNIVELGLIIFDKLIMKNNIIKQKFLQCLLDLLNEYRTRQNNNIRQIIQNLQQIFDVFQNAQAHRLEIVSNAEKQIVIQIISKTQRSPNLEAPESTFINYLFDSSIESLRKFYNELSKNWLKSGSCAEYLNKAIQINQVQKKTLNNFFIQNLQMQMKIKKLNLLRYFILNSLTLLLYNINKFFIQQKQLIIISQYTSLVIQILNLQTLSFTILNLFSHQSEQFNFTNHFHKFHFFFHFIHLPPHLIFELISQQDLSIILICQAFFLLIQVAVNILILLFCLKIIRKF